MPVRMLAASALHAVSFQQELKAVSRIYRACIVVIIVELTNNERFLSKSVLVGALATPSLVFIRLSKTDVAFEKILLYWMLAFRFSTNIAQRVLLWLLTHRCQPICQL